MIYNVVIIGKDGAEFAQMGNKFSVLKREVQQRSKHLISVKLDATLGIITRSNP